MINLHEGMPKRTVPGSNSRSLNLQSDMHLHANTVQTPVDFYHSINVMWINLFVFQMPGSNRFAKEIG